QSGAEPHPLGRCQAVLPTEVLTRPEPDRASLRQAQASVAKGRRTHARSHLRRHRRNRRDLHAPRMRQLLQKLRLSNLKSSDSSPDVRAPNRPSPDRFLSSLACRAAAKCECHTTFNGLTWPPVKVGSFVPTFGSRHGSRQPAFSRPIRPEFPFRQHRTPYL